MRPVGYACRLPGRPERGTPVSATPALRGQAGWLPTGREPLGRQRLLSTAAVAAGAASLCCQLDPATSTTPESTLPARPIAVISTSSVPTSTHGVAKGQTRAKLQTTAKLQTPPPPARSASSRTTALRVAQVEIRRGLEADLAKSVGATTAPSLAQVAKRVLVWWVNPRRDLRPGDRLDLVWTPQKKAEPKVHAVWFESGKLRAKRSAVLYRRESSAFPRWVDPETGWEVPLRLKHSPVEEYEQITSLVNDGRGHRGVDFKAPIGTPVRAPFAGRVSKVNWYTRTNGRCVKLKDLRSGRDALFLHLSRVDRKVRPGRDIRRGQIIGWVGNTGRSFAPHLHYQLEKNGRTLDPFRVHSTWRAQLSKVDLGRAKRLFNRLSALRIERN